MVRYCSKCGKQIWKRNQSGLCLPCLTRTPESRKLRSDRLRNTRRNSSRFDKLQDIPADKIDEYKILTRSKRISAAEARRILGVTSD